MSETEREKEKDGNRRENYATLKNLRSPVRVGLSVRSGNDLERKERVEGLESREGLCISSIRGARTYNEWARRETNCREPSRSGSGHEAPSSSQ